MSTLRVGNITATGGTGTITVPTGNKIAQTGAVLQVVSTAKTDTFTTASTSYVEVTGLTATITPTSSTSNILVMVQLTGGFYQVGTTAGFIRLRRDSTDLFLGNAEGSRERVTVTGTQNSTAVTESIPIIFLDSPATTSSVTYRVVVRGDAGTMFVNRPSGTTDSANHPRSASSITVMEIAG